MSDFELNDIQKLRGFFLAYLNYTVHAVFKVFEGQADFCSHLILMVI